MSRIYGLIGTRLPIHPQPYPDELFTHWFFRLAHKNHLKAQTLADYAFGRQSSFWARDQDKFASHQVIHRLADLTGQPPDDIRALTLAAYEGTVYASHNAQGHNRWILPLGIYHRTWRRFGLQYCPLCLFGDAEPYFRRRWRLVLSTVCEKHGVLMYDSCYCCGAPVMFFRNDLGNRACHNFCSSARCNACGADLSRAPAYDPPGPDGQTLVISRSLSLALEMGWWWAGSETIHFGHLFFDVLHHLATLLASQRGRKLLNEIERRIGQTPLQGRLSRSKMLELRPFEERHWLLLMALWLLQDWPERFIETCQAARMWQSWLLAGELLPWWFVRVVKDKLDRSIYCPNDEEANSVAEYLMRRGQALSRHSIGQLLGSSDHLATQCYTVKPQWHWPQTNEDFSRLLAASDVQIQSLRPGSVRYLLAERDRAIFTLMKATGWKAARVLRLSCADLKTMSGSGEASRWCEARWSLLRYVHSIRPALLGETRCEALFIGHAKDGISVDALVHRLKNLLSGSG